MVPLVWALRTAGQDVLFGAAADGPAEAMQAELVSQFTAWVAC